MNIVDSLIIRLGLDASGVAKGQRQAKDSLEKTGRAAEKLHKDVDESTKRMAEGCKKLYDGVIAVTAAIVGMVAGKAVVDHLTKQDAALTRSSKFLKVSTQDLENWRGAAIQTGDTADGAQDAFESLSAQMQKMALTGKSDMIPFLNQAHVDVRKFFDAATPLPEKLKLIQDAMKGMDPARAKALIEGMGLGGLTNSLTTERSVFDRLLEDQQRLNAHSKESDEATVRRQQAMQRVDAAFEGVARTIKTLFSPAIEWVLNFIANHAPAATGMMLGLSAAMTALSAIKFAGLAGNLAQLGGSIAGVATQAATLLTFLGRMGLVGAAGAVGFGLGTLLEEQTGVGSSFGRWLWEKVNGGGPDMAGGYVPGTIKGLRGGGGSSSDPAGIRNNNPGNLNFAGQTGATRAGRFAAFGSMAEGIAAMDDQLQRYAARGNDTVRGIVNTWAPASDHNDTNGYIAAVARALGVDANSHLNLNDANQLRALIAAMTTQEVGAGRISVDQINAGMALSMGRSSGGATTQVVIEHVSVHTSASTMSGTGDDLGRSLRRHVAAQSNTGVQ